MERDIKVKTERQNAQGYPVYQGVQGNIVPVDGLVVDVRMTGI